LHAMQALSQLSYTPRTQDTSLLAGRRRFPSHEV
jgi:hypothetical protein